MTPNRPLPPAFSDISPTTPASRQITRKQGRIVDDRTLFSQESLQSFVQAPPYQDNFSMSFFELDHTQNQDITDQHEHSDSVYASNLSGPRNYSSGQTENEMLTNSNASSSEPRDQQESLAYFADIDLSQTSGFFESSF